MERELLELTVSILERAIENTLPEALARAHINRLERRIEQLGSPDIVLMGQIEAYRRARKSWTDISIALNKSDDIRLHARRAKEWSPANIRMWHRRYAGALEDVN